MDTRAQEEGDERRGVLVDFERRDGGMVDVAEEEIMDWSIETLRAE